jgi:hypothetical protein
MPKNRGMASKNLDPILSGQVIDALGGTCTVASICEISPASVSGWRVNGMPAARAQFFRLRDPDVFRRFDNNNARRQRKQASKVEGPQKRSG